MSSPEMDDHRGERRRSSSLNRNSGGRNFSNKNYDNYNSRGNYNNRNRNNKAQVVASNISTEASDHDVKDVLHHEMEKFGDIANIYLRGRDQGRHAYVTFCDDSAARELRRYCLEDHRKVIAFERTLHFDFQFGGGGDFNHRNNNRDRSDDRGYNDRRNLNYNNRNNYQKQDYRNDRNNGRNDNYDNNDSNRGRGYNDHHNNRGDKYNDRDNHINPKATRTLFVGNLEHSITKDELMRIFDHYGAIDDIDVKRPPNGIPAYAFIKYLELESASSAKNQMFGKEIHGRPIKVGYGKTLPSPRLWIGGLGQWCSSEMLNREFDRFGALRKIDYVKGDRHAFIEFENLDASSAAHAEMRGFPLGGPDRKIKIDYAEIDRNRKNDNDRNNDNHSDDGRYNDRSRGRYDNRDNFGRGRGRGSYNNRSYGKRDHRNSNDRDNERDRRRSRTPRSRSPRSRTPRTQSPVNSERDYARRTPPGRHTPPPRTRNDSSPRGRTRKDSSASKEDETNGHSSSPMDDKALENLSDVAKRFVVAWKGAFALKNSAFPVRMHLIGGNPELANFYLRGMGVGAGPAIKILSVTQRLRLDPPKLDEVSRRIQLVGAGGYCIFLALPIGDEVELDGSFQRRPLKSLVTYFTKKEAAGVIILNGEGKAEDAGMLHAFPPCEFSQQQLLKAAPNIGSDPSKEDHLVVIVVKGTT